MEKRFFNDKMAPRRMKIIKYFSSLIMYTYKIEVKKIKGFITESVQSQGLNLTIKSKKKMTNESLFERADDYLNEKYGIRLVEAKFRPYGSPVRMGGNTRLKDYYGIETPHDIEKEAVKNFFKQYDDYTGFLQLMYDLEKEGIISSDKRKNFISEFKNFLIDFGLNKNDMEEGGEKFEKALDKFLNTEFEKLITPRIMNYIKRKTTQKIRQHRLYTSDKVADNEYNPENKKRRGAKGTYYGGERKKIVCEVHWQSSPYIKEEDWDDEDWRSHDRHIEYINSLSDEGWRLVFARNEGEIEKEIIKKLINPKYGNYPKTERLDDNGFKFVVETKKGLIEYRVFYTIATGKRATELRNMDEGDYIGEKEGGYSSDYESPYYRHGVTGEFLHDDDPRGWVY